MCGQITVATQADLPCIEAPCMRGTSAASVIHAVVDFRLKIRGVATIVIIPGAHYTLALGDMDDDETEGEDEAAAA